MSSIFAAPVAASTSSDRIEFKAGKLSQQGRLVVPDPRKGLISVKISDDGLLHLMWIDRRTNMTEDVQNYLFQFKDLIVFPDEAELVHVPQCTTGRVFVLKYKTSSQRFFIWMQDSNDKNDSDIVKRVNVMINNPPSASHNSTNVFGGSIGSQNQNEMLSAMLRGSGLVNVTMNINQGAAMQALPAAALNRLLNMQYLGPLLRDAELKNSILPFLDQNAPVNDSLIEHIKSNNRAIERLQALHVALVTNKLTAATNHYGIDSSVNGSFGGLDVFLSVVASRRRSDNTSQMDITE
ncbi:26S proteasome complex ubiquitin receptor, subunit Rpn13 domain-containing protein [Rozella allomycis CSF55]|uniref:26S proteasome complex ubiquitin receptor, subunit Rpn13 domain-containing protein n=1 Tax=Rozella allomycis (strain CSF55) TaxID=988480 RepID=A0A075AZS5_ROZAC|nr:26S proteasome complex ubiquitin receptor, subunit Rpn13 domain-containing protein [Rozella allomycis CSF55]|eukprot:EPZ35841.1 26S proteasome complex ubiquitin receptor, subunit Rpn13 domain-containing protein [Rozella allomycis CSF55]